MCVGTLADPKTVGDKCPNDGTVPVCCYTIVSSSGSLLRGVGEKKAG